MMQWINESTAQLNESMDRWISQSRSESTNQSMNQRFNEDMHQKNK